MRIKLPKKSIDELACGRTHRREVKEAKLFD
jgi:hypothetical protein